MLALLQFEELTEALALASVFGGDVAGD